MCDIILRHFSNTVKECNIFKLRKIVKKKKKKNYPDFSLGSQNFLAASELIIESEGFLCQSVFEGYFIKKGYLLIYLINLS